MSVGQSVMTCAELERRIAAARCAAARAPASANRRLAMLDRVVVEWLRPDSPFMHAAQQELPRVTGFSAEMIRHGLPTMFEPLRGERIGALLDAELGDRRVLDEVSDGRRAVAPALITHVLAGNIPGLAVAPVLLSLAIKSAVLVKCAAGDVVTPPLLAQSICEVDAALGESVVVADWRGGDRDFERIAFAADIVVASGSDAAIAAIASRTPVRFIGHGHKISFAAVDRDCLRDEAAAQTVAHRLAYDISLWDQQGCLSPQLCYLESGGRIGPRQFATLLAHELGHWARALPPRRLSFEERAAVLRFRQEAEWQPGGGTLLASSDSTEWSISVEPDATFVPTCLNRCIRLKVVDDLSMVPTALAPYRGQLEAAGIAIAERDAALSQALMACGVPRICPLGTMQLPDLSWRQGGRPRVAEWVRLEG